MATYRPNTTLLGSLVIFVLITTLWAQSPLVDLNEDNWHQMLEGEWMVEFYAPWCPACKALKPVWEDFADLSEMLEINVGHVDVTTSPGLSGRFMVTALPTIFHVKDGVFRLYRGSREREKFVSFIEEKRWEDVEEIPSWKSPASFQMSVVSQFFKLSMVLRGFHSILMEEYGLPTWGSYLVFALATIVVGALLGLILVCFIDCVFPPKAPGPSTPVVTSAGLKADDDEEDLIEDSKPENKHLEEEEEDLLGKDEDENVEKSDEGEKSQSEGEAENEDSQTEADKKSASQGEETEEDEEEEESQESKSSPGVRRRRPRKAD